MLLDLQDAHSAPLAGPGEQQVDCILGPSRAIMDPIDQWENEGGRVPSANVDRWRDWYRGLQRASVVKLPLAARPAARSDARLSSADLYACGRCHGPVSLGRYSLLGRLLNSCMAVEQYHCVDAACGWSGIRMSSGLSSRLLLERRAR